MDCGELFDLLASKSMSPAWVGSLGSSTFLNMIQEVTTKMKENPSYIRLDREDLLGRVNFIKPMFDEYLTMDAPRRSGKKVLDVKSVRKSKKLHDIQHSIAQSRYPGEDPDGQMSKLLLFRSEHLIKVSAPDLKYDLLLRDLKLICLEEIDPKDEHQYWYLKTLCEIKTSELVKAKDSLVKAEQTLGKAGYSEKTMQNRKGKIAKGRNQIEEKIKNTHLATSSIANEQVKQVPTVGEANQRFPALSNKVTVVANSGDLENGLVATQKISAGVILGIEAPVVQAPFHHDVTVTFSHCHHCLVYTTHLLPCPDCSEVMFCSFNCRDGAIASYHKAECEVNLNALVCIFEEEQASTALGLLLRMIFEVPVEQHLQNTEDDVQMTSFTQDNPYLSDDWFNLWRLKKHSVSPRQESDIVHVAFAYRLLCKSSYLNQVSKKSLPMAQARIVKCLMAAYQIMKTNFFTIKEPKQTTRLVDSLDELLTRVDDSRVGTGGYNTMSLINHSCVANCHYFFYEHKFVLVARRFIEKGEDVTICYGPDIDDELNLRQLRLSLTHNFVCKCLGCTSGWSGRQLADMVPFISPRQQYNNDMREQVLKAQRDLQGLLELRIQESLGLYKSLPRNMYIRYTVYFSDIIIQALQYKHCLTLL